MKKANLSNALRRLHHDELRGVRLRRLELRAIALQRRISSELANELPNEFWDWLSDFDVRAKAPEIAAEQRTFIVELISQLEHP